MLTELQYYQYECRHVQFAVICITTNKQFITKKNRKNSPKMKHCMKMNTMPP